jgi:hypothetical protein
MQGEKKTLFFSLSLFLPYLMRTTCQVSATHGIVNEIVTLQVTEQNNNKNYKTLRFYRLCVLCKRTF